MKYVVLLSLLLALQGCAASGSYRLNLVAHSSSDVSIKDLRTEDEKEWGLGGFPNPIVYLGDMNTEPTRLKVLAHQAQQKLGDRPENLEIIVERFELIDYPNKTSAQIRSGSASSISPALGLAFEPSDEVRNLIVCNIDASLNGNKHQASSVSSYEETPFAMKKYEDPPVIAAVSEALNGCVESWVSHFGGTAISE